MSLASALHFEHELLAMQYYVTMRSITEAFQRERLCMEMADRASAQRAEMCTLQNSLGTY